jgi:hypothetical protein
MDMLRSGTSKFLALLTVVALPLLTHAQKPPTPRPAYIESRLLKAGLQKDFVDELLKSYETKGFDDVLRLNIILFLKKTDDHGIQVTSQAVREVRAFQAKYRGVLRKAEIRFGVPAKVIASLLWIE